ncbi:MAG: alpha-1,2-fucosyltransferase [Nibricoccus sp.]
MRLQGGLGNQMFQYALGRHLAIRNSTELVLDTTYFEYVPKDEPQFVKREYALQMFNIVARSLDRELDPTLPTYSAKRSHRLRLFAKRTLNLYSLWDKYVILNEGRYFAFEDRVLQAGQNTYLNGYWQNPKYFEAIAAQIQADFSFKISFDDRISALASEIAGCHSVCINVRRGDFVTNSTHGVVGTDYISRALEYVTSRRQVQKIYVFSDEIEWCEQNLRFEVPHVFVGHDYAGPGFSAYLHLMRQCRYFVIPNSTFGWWAAWLSNQPDKLVVAPKNWVNVEGLDSSGVLPKDWMAV